MNPGKLITIAVCLTCLSSTAWALKSDRSKPVKISANHVVVDRKKGVSTYTGDVHMEQGTLIIRGDEVIVHHENGKLKKITIKGKPASFQQQPDNKQAMVQSKAEHMEYFTKNELLVLQKNAEVIQGQNQFSGDHIEYDTFNSVVKANKGSNSKSRVHAIIQPEDKNQQDKDKPKEP
jgi:lipopolysaccharide export system protein LptA